MKKIIYNIALESFPVLLRVVSPFHPKAKKMIDGRKNWKRELSEKHFGGKRIWFHCASLGEFEQGRPVMEQIKKAYPGCSIIVTFFSPSGYEIQKDYELADYVCYLPFDSKKNSSKFIELLTPDVAIFVKYEFWYYYLKELSQRKIPTFSISAIFRPDQQFFKKRGGLFREMLHSFDHFFVQNEESRKLLTSEGYENVTVTGDTRFDRVIEICSKPKKLDVLPKFKGRSRLMIIGSSWPDDIEVLLPLINDSKNQLKFMIAPHEVGEEKVRRLCKGITVDYQRLSSLNEATLTESKVLIIDSIGLLSSLYQYGEMAYIGGAFGDGLHNILEAATFSMPIIFGKGKDNHKFQEAIDLVDKGGAFEISTSEEITDLVTKLLGDAERLKETSRICKDYVMGNAGATASIMNYLQKYLT